MWFKFPFILFKHSFHSVNAMFTEHLLWSAQQVSTHLYYTAQVRLHRLAMHMLDKKATLWENEKANKLKLPKHRKRIEGRKTYKTPTQYTRNVPGLKREAYDWMVLTKFETNEIVPTDELLEHSKRERERERGRRWEEQEQHCGTIRDKTSQHD